MPGPDEEEVAAAPADEPDYSRRVIGVDGEVYEFPTPEAAAEALSRRDMRGRPLYSGPDTPDARESRRVRRVYGDRPIAAGSAGAASVTTFGLSDVVGAELGYGEDLRGLREANPDATFAGELAGGILPVLAFGPLGGGALGAAGEAGTAARLLRAATAPVRGLAGLSSRLGGAAGGALRGAGTSALRRAAGTVGGLAVEGAVEGAGYEATRAVSDAALLENPDLSAEAILGRLGTGALMGGLGGAALGTGGSLLREIGGGTVNAARHAATTARAAYERAGGSVLPDSFWDAVAGPGFDAFSAISGRPREAMGRVFGAGDDARAIRAMGLAGVDPRTIERGTTEIVDSLDDLARATSTARSVWSYGPKRSIIDAAIDTSRRGEQELAASSALRSIAEMRDRLADPSLFHPDNVRQYVGRMRDWMDGFLNDASPGGSTDLFMALDGLKRQVGEMVDGLSRSGENIASLPDIRRIFTDIRSTLEDEALWGGAAGVQRTVNEAVSNSMIAGEAFNREFLGGAPIRGDDRFMRIPQANSMQVDAFLRRAGNAARNSTSAANFRNGISAHENMLRVMSETLDLDPSVRNEIANGITASSAAQARFTESVRQAEMLNTWYAISHNMGQGGTERAIGAGLAGMAVGGPVGAAIGALVTSPSIVARGVALVERFTTGTSDDITNSVRSFLRRSGAAVSGAGRAVAPRARRAALYGAAAYARRSAELDEEQRNPRRAVDTLTSRIRDLDDMPTVRAGVIAGASRANAYLRRTRPAPRAMAGQIRPQSGAQPSSAEMAQWLRRVRAVESPISILDDLRSGRLTPEAVEAVRVVYPELYRQIQQTIIREMVDPAAQPSYSQRISMGILLGIPTDPALSPGHMEVTQGIYAAAAAMQPPATSKTPNVAGAVASGSESLERRRSTA